jgi:hypothetical protein
MTVIEPKLIGAAQLSQDIKQALQTLYEMFLSFPSESISEIIRRRELELRALEELIAHKAGSLDGEEFTSRESPPGPSLPFYMKPFDHNLLTTSHDDYY